MKLIALTVDETKAMLNLVGEELKKYARGDKSIDAVMMSELYDRLNVVLGKGQEDGKEE